MRFSLIIVVIGGIMAGCADKQSGQSDAPTSEAWAAYQLDDATPEQRAQLFETPYMYPTRSCRSAADFPDLPASAEITINEAGEETVCVWNSPSAAAPEGINFSEIGSCDHVFTQAPSWFVHPERTYQTDVTLLDDDAYRAELLWAQQEFRSSGCSCCHSSQAGSNYGTAFDSDAPEVWTDTISNARLFLLSGEIEGHREFGAYEPSENHGASSFDVMIPSSDPQRLRAFFLSEFERRGGTQDDKDHAQEQVTTFFGRKKVAPRDCIDPFEGLIDGKLTWNSERGARQIYVQELGSEAPGFPPNLDKPEGTVWAIRVPYTEDAIAPGTVTLGELPVGAVQLEPQDGSVPVFESGNQYRIYITPDVMLLSHANCIIEIP